MEVNVLREIGIWLRISSAGESFDRKLGQREKDWNDNGLRLARDWAKVNYHLSEGWVGLGG